MDTTTSVIATGLVVTTGRWANEQSLGIKMFVGFGVLAIMLEIMAATNEKLAGQFALLILVSALLIYGVPIGKKIGGLDK
jgi:hypothetical protein